MISQASHDARVAGLERRLYFCEDDATRLASARDGEFDIAVCLTNTLGNMSTEKARHALQQMHRVLRPGGRLFVSVYSPHSVDARVRSYREVGLHVRANEHYVEAAEGLVSACFSREEIYDLLSKNGFSPTRHRDLATVGLVVEGERL
jgi:SAM-dependent methyltransferase